MSRIRSIKPEIWSSEKFVTCSHAARLFFIGLWNFADCGGVHTWQPRSLKLQIFPADDEITLASIREFADELVAADLCRYFEHENQWFIWIKGWKDHQKIDHPAYRHPGPLNPRSRALAERSPNAPPRIGRDRKGDSENPSPSPSLLPRDQFSPNAPRTLASRSEDERTGTGTRTTDDLDENAKAIQIGAGGAVGPEAVKIITALDRAIVTTWGQGHARPFPGASDGVEAQRLAAEGVTGDLASSVLSAVCAKHKAQGKPIPRTLGYVAADLRAALKRGDQPSSSNGTGHELDALTPEQITERWAAIDPDIAGVRFDRWRQHKDWPESVQGPPPDQVGFLGPVKHLRRWVEANHLEASSFPALRKGKRT